MLRLVVATMLLVMMAVLLFVGWSYDHGAVIQWSVGIISPLGTLIMLSWARDFVKEDIDYYNRTDKGSRAVRGLWILIVIQDAFIIMKVFDCLDWSWLHIAIPSILAVVITIFQVIRLNPPEGGRFRRFRRSTTDWG